MNSLDVLIIIALVLFFANRERMSFVMYAMASFGAFYGYIAGLLLAAGMNYKFDTYLARGMFAYGAAIFLAILGAYIGVLLGNKLRMRLIESRFYTYDRLLTLPLKVFVATCAIWLISQTFIYIPVVAIQYLAQGSGFVLNFDKMSGDSFPSAIVEDIAPNQYKDRVLEYDTDPLTYKGLEIAAEFKDSATTVAPSVVKVSSRMCPAFGRGIGSGSGFVVAPGYIVTNSHVVLGMSTIYIRTHEAIFPATPIIIDEKHDIAVLYSKFLVDEKPLQFVAQKPTEGTRALIMGYPGARDLTVALTTTMNTADVKLNQDKTSLNGSNSLKLDAGLGKGSSGGPIINNKGEVIAITYAGRGSVSLGIDAAIAQELVAKAKDRRYAAHTGYCTVFKGYN